MSMSYVVSGISYCVLRIAYCVSVAGCERRGRVAAWCLGEKGLVLVGVLWLKIILIAIVAIAVQNSRLDFKVRVIGTEELRCRWACRAGIEKAVGILNEDPKECDDLTELWSDNDEDFNGITLEGCVFSVRVIDEASKLNVNTATKVQLMELPEMLEEIADAIIDWRDSDSTVSGAGAEGEYYELLPYPYTIRNGPFQTVRELLLVRGVTEELLYGEDTNFNGQLDHNENDGDQAPPNDDANGELDLGWIEYLTCYSYDKNTGADGEARININQASQSELESSLGLSSSHARWIVDNRSYNGIGDLINNNSDKEPQSGNSNNAQPLDLQTFAGIADKITVGDGQQTQGKVNINTAPEYVLAALLGGGESGLQLAEAIIAYREEQLYGMESIADVLQSGGMSVATFKQVADLIAVRSDVYTIRCVATGTRAAGDGMSIRTETVVDRSSTPYVTLYWYQGANN
ncbi:MAG TPA: type II secretion system protein GspK [Sedimentisphaerales bacterium]|nr:type II secretion system protein GspK [Sedimentisphaerales bacterium]